MSIGIDFLLRWNSAAFTKGLASASNSLKDLKKGFREFDVGSGLKQALGVGGVIAGFRTAIMNAQELRDEARKLGKEIDAGTQSVAEFGDALAGIGGGFKNALTSGLSFFTGLGDGMRRFFQDVTEEQEQAARKMVETTAKAADEAEARLKKSREANSPEKQAEAQEKLDKAQIQSKVRGTDAEKKLVNLVNERVALDEKLAKTGKATVEYKEIQAEIAKNEKDTAEATSSFDKEADARKKKKKEEFRKDVADKFLPSVEQLANMEVGTGVGGDDPRIKARRILEQEKFAAEAASRGDIKGALKIGTQASNLRKGLEESTGKGTALTAETAETALRSALEQTNKELEGVREQLKGLIKAQ